MARNFLFDLNPVNIGLHHTCCWLAIKRSTFESPEDILQEPICVIVFKPCFPRSSVGKESACSTGDLGSIPGLGRSPGRGQGNLHQQSCLENPHEQRSLAGYGAWGRKELDMTKYSTVRVLGFSDGTSGKEPACQCRRHRDTGLIPGSGRSPGDEKGY